MLILASSTTHHGKNEKDRKKHYEDPKKTERARKRLAQSFAYQSNNFTC